MSSTTTAWPRVSAVLASLPQASDVSVAILNPATGERFSHEADAVMSSASTIKTLILIALSRAVDAGKLTLDHRVPVLPTQLAAGSGILNELRTPIELSLADHAHLMIAISDNTASNVLIDAVGVESIAETAATLGLTATALQRRFLGRLPDPGTPENLTSANDLVSMVTVIATGSAASPDLSAWMRERLAAQHYLNRLARFLPAGVSFAGKGGTLEGFAHDCGVFASPAGEVVTAVMVQNVRDAYATDALIGSIGEAAIHDAGLV